MEKGENQKEGSSRHAWLFLLEICCAVLLFAIAAAVILTVFAAGKKKQDEADALHLLNTDVQNVEELIRSSDSMSDFNTAMKQQYEVTAVSDTQWNVTLDDGWQIGITADPGSSAQDISAQDRSEQNSSAQDVSEQSTSEQSTSGQNISAQKMSDQGSSGLYTFELTLVDKRGAKRESLEVKHVMRKG